MYTDYVAETYWLQTHEKMFRTSGHAGGSKSGSLGSGDATENTETPDAWRLFASNEAELAGLTSPKPLLMKETNQ